MLGKIFSRQANRGDTLIEVLIAVTIFSLIAVGGISVMNQGAATAQRSLEITLVRQEIDAQAEALRFLNATYNAAFIKDQTTDKYSDQAQTWLGLPPIVTKISTFGVGDNGKCPKAPANSFVINTRSLKMQLLSSAPTDGNHSITYAKVNFDDANNSTRITSIDGLWVEAIHSLKVGNSDYVDFNIRACWDSLGQSTPMTLGTVVRLYEPL